MLRVTLSTFVELVFLSSDNKLKKSREWWGEGVVVRGAGEGGVVSAREEHQTWRRLLLILEFYQLTKIRARWGAARYRNQPFSNYWRNLKRRIISSVIFLQFARSNLALQSHLNIHPSSASSFWVRPHKCQERWRVSLQSGSHWPSLYITPSLS